MHRASPLSALALALSLGMCAVAVWRWQAAVFRTPRLTVATEPWDQVRRDYPMPDSAPEAPVLSDETLQEVVRANPFSPERRHAAAAPGDSGEGSGGSAAAQAPEPIFLYKGRINLGQRQRAIMEDLAAKKTYFLEVGQEVAKFKVLDITEDQVVLSDPQTGEPVVVPLSSKKDEPRSEAKPGSLQ